MGIKMPVTKWSAKPWTQLELSVQSPVISGSTTNLYMYFVRYMDSCNYKHLNIVTAEPLILAGSAQLSLSLPDQTNQWNFLQKAEALIALASDPTASE